MPLYKIRRQQILTFLQNTLLQMRLTEFHSGYRVYSVATLRAAAFQFNTNGLSLRHRKSSFSFSSRRARILEIPIPTFYGDEICRVNGVRYAWNVLKVSLAARLHRRASSSTASSTSTRRSSAIRSRPATPRRTPRPSIACRRAAAVLDIGMAWLRGPRAGEKGHATCRESTRRPTAARR